MGSQAIQKARTATDPAERQRLMVEHDQKIQEHRASMAKGDNRLPKRQRSFLLRGLSLIQYLGVRRQNIWHNSRRRIAECGPRLGLMFRRRACGVASADVRVSFA